MRFLKKYVAINALVDIDCLFTFIPSLVTGLVLFLVLPSGSGRQNYRAPYPGVTRSDQVSLHNVHEPRICRDDYHP